MVDLPGAEGSVPGSCTVGNRLQLLTCGPFLALPPEHPIHAGKKVSKWDNSPDRQKPGCGS